MFETNNRRNEINNIGQQAITSLVLNYTPGFEPLPGKIQNRSFPADKIGLFALVVRVPLRYNGFVVTCFRTSENSLRTIR
jgi:hypothetical protein